MLPKVLRTISTMIILASLLLLPAFTPSKSFAGTKTKVWILWSLIYVEVEKD